ncbi:MAG: acyl-CoA dehydrogenase family protein [Candidatus Sericytochromatia bacterium]
MHLFEQAAPQLPDPYRSDPYLRGLLARHLSAEQLEEADLALQQMSAWSGGELYTLQLQDRLNEPQLIQWDPWGQRIDAIQVSPLWRRAEQIAAEAGLVATAYEQHYGALSRLVQFALVYLFTPSSDIYSCPLAMTDGAARTLLGSDNADLVERALPHLTSREPSQFWTSGQWMTELTGGSDVGQTETVARYENGQWRLYGRKWFTSATTSQMALTLARPEGNGPGGKGLALFYIEPRDAQGRLQGIEVNRLKDKLGTRKVPTAELLLKGAPAQLVLGTSDGVRNIAPMLNVTRTWNSVSAIALMRRGLSLAWDYASRRKAFGAALIDKPLHRDTLEQLEAEFAGAFYLTFEGVNLLGKQEAGELSESGQALLRALTPVIKLTTAKQAVAVLSEVLECFGGAGYVEDTGLPMLLRDAQVLPIWEGTTNVLSLDTLRVLAQSDQARVILQQMLDWGQGIDSSAVRQARQTLVQAFEWLVATQAHEPGQAEASARRFALTLGRSLSVLAMARQIAVSETLDGTWSLQLERLQKRYLQARPLNYLEVR